MNAEEKRRLYQRITKGLSDHLVLQRMRLHGFWPKDEDLPPDPPAEREERRLLEEKLRLHAAVQSGKLDPEKALEAERKRRWQESKLRRQQRKAERAQAREAKRLAWEEHQRQTVTHLGREVSHGLNPAKPNETLLKQQGLPVFQNGTEVARAMGIPLPELKWLTYHRRATALVHYRRYCIPKKSGGQRAISAPKPKLARAQHWILKQVLARVAVSPQAHGFVPGKSIRSNALPHVGRKVVLNLDLKDFFPSLDFRRVKGLFRALGYGEDVAVVFALFCTEPPRIAAVVNDKPYYVALSDRCLPQGACTSPALTNLICRRLDRRLCGMAHSYGFTFTRYADDLTFSGDQTECLSSLLSGVRKVITDEGFTENTAKTQIMRAGRRQEVTGLNVNTKVAVSRSERRSLRAILHNCKVHGPESQCQGALESFAAHICGKVAFITMADPTSREAWMTALDASGLRPHAPPRPEPSSELPPADARAAEVAIPGKKWWKWW